MTHNNRLAAETSPYLLQHAHNPVDWYPWNEEALDRARREDKPILISIGYSACHWCHVMEQESFEDQETASVMNELFVNVKVDREERPDLDKIYQTAHQMLVQRPGGWPLNMFLTPQEHLPIFGGTYFPREARHGLPPFKEILRRVAEYYRQYKNEVEKQNNALTTAFSQMQAPHRGPGLSISADMLLRAREDIERQFDARHGGFGRAPKFFHPTTLTRCLRHWAAGAIGGNPDAQALHMARYTLHAMASGGVYDQLGGGFCRYSVDEAWMIPHFEKMLYDNGQLLALYAQAALATGDDTFARIAGQTGDWVMREMQSPHGGYYSTLDADSEGEEGKFYVWTSEALQGLLDADEWSAMALRYGLDGNPNFEGKWNLHVSAGVDAIAERLGRPAEEVRARLAGAQQKLFAAREKRVRPGRDEKILTSWNALMIKGMACAGRLLQRPDFIDSAEKALDYLRGNLWTHGRLLATAKDGKAHLNAYLDDYAFLIDGTLELLQARWRDGELQFVIALAEVLLEHFEDGDRGAFFFTADDHESLVYRPKPDADEAMPSGNGIAAYALQRLGHLLGERRYLEAAERTIRALYPVIEHYRPGFGSLLDAVEESLEPPQTVILRGRPESMQAWQQRCQRAYAPRRLTLAIPDDAKGLPAMLVERTNKDTVTAYVCTGHACSAPITKLTQLEAELVQEEVEG